MITVRSNAKINISLDLVGKREDGYHLLRSVMQTVTLCDVLTVKKSRKTGIYIRCNKPYIPTDERNIVYKVAKAFFDKYIIMPSLSVTLKKNIPSGAGLGGGSSNGAAVLNALCELYDISMTVDEKMSLTESIGADIPFFFMGGTALVEGVGEKITQLPPCPECWIVISKPPKSVSTAMAYSSPFTEQMYGGNSTDAIVDAVNADDIKGIIKNAKNALEPASIGLCSEIGLIKEQLYECDAKLAMMSGSGSAVFSVFTDHKSAYKAYKKLSQKYKDTFITKPQNSTSK